MKYTFKRILSFSTILVYFFAFSMIDLVNQAEGIRLMNTAHAEEVYPYTQMFGITAYYSPLPGQLKYVTGSYAGDIRLNGRGTNGADGTPVYAGMIAAPKTYKFGTKLFIPGVGMSAVHDRGGAIVLGTGDNGSGPKYDRLDIWMGYGDKGLQRALRWGYQKLEVTVYGINADLDEDVLIGDFSINEKDNQEYFYIPDYYTDSVEIPSMIFKDDLWYLDQGDEVEKLQEYLNQLGYFHGDVNGYFGDETRMALYLYQKDKGLIQNIADLGAGHFGSQTRKALEETILTRKKELAPKTNLGTDDKDPDNVKKLQKLLKISGYDVIQSGIYSSRTTAAVIKFQKDSGVIASDTDWGAGYFGPKTSSALVKKLGELLEAGKVDIPVAHANEEVKDLVKNRAVLTTFMHENLSLGSTGPEVTRLQKELQSLNLLRKTPTGTYDEVTEHAIYKFQQSQGIVASKADQGAGTFGPSTRDTLNKIISSKNYYAVKIAEKAVN